MALTDEDLLAISGLLDAKLGALDAKWETKLGALDAKWETKLDRMDDRLKRVELRLENDVVPRLQNIEDCYVSTYERYRENAAGYAGMQADLEIMKKVIMDHSEKLKKMA